MFEAAILAYEQKVRIFRNASDSIFDLQDKSFICTKFQTFTTFSAIDNYAKEGGKEEV